MHRYISNLKKKNEKEKTTHEVSVVEYYSSKIGNKQVQICMALLQI